MFCFETYVRKLEEKATGMCFPSFGSSNSQMALDV